MKLTAEQFDRLGPNAQMIVEAGRVEENLRRQPVVSLAEYREARRVVAERRASGHAIWGNEAKRPTTKS